MRLDHDNLRRSNLRGVTVVRNIEKNHPVAAGEIDGQLSDGKHVPANENIMWFREVGEDGEISYRINPIWVNHFAPKHLDILGYPVDDLEARIRRKNVQFGFESGTDGGTVRTSVNKRSNSVNSLRRLIRCIVRKFNFYPKAQA